MPAYGRIYDTEREVLKAWSENKDFKIYNGPYVNKSDWAKHGNMLDSLTYCYRDLTVYIQTGYL